MFISNEHSLLVDDEHEDEALLSGDDVVTRHGCSFVSSIVGLMILSCCSRAASDP